MRLKLQFFTMLLSVLSLFGGVSHADDLCADSTITYKLEGKNNELRMNLCRNQFGQFYSKGCQDGCKFRKYLESNPIEEEKATFPSPALGVCRKMGFISYISEVNFGGKIVKNIELCFDEKKINLISKNFLGDIVYEINMKKKNK